MQSFEANFDGDILFVNDRIANLILDRGKYYS